MLDRSLEDTLPYLFALLGLRAGDDQLAQMGSQIRRRRMHEAIKRILVRESLNQPLMLIFEDLHWIDGETQDLLNLLVNSIYPAPTRPARTRQRRGDAELATRRPAGTRAAQAARDRAHRGQSVLHGGNRAGAP